MTFLVETGKYGAINGEYITTLGYDVVKYFSGPYKLQEDKTKYGKASKADDLAFKYEHLTIMKKKLALATKRN